MKLVRLGLPSMVLQVELFRDTRAQANMVTGSDSQRSQSGNGSRYDCAMLCLSKRARATLSQLDGHFVEVLGRYSNLRDQGERVQTLIQIVPEGASELNLRTPRQVQRRLAPDEVSKLIARYETGETVKELSQRHGLHRETVSNILTRRGIARRPTGIPTERVADVIADYKNGLSLTAIGAKLSVDPATVSSALRKAGTEVRPRRGWSRRTERAAGPTD